MPLAEQENLPQPKKLPVIVFSGFLGSGKTTLLNRVLANRNDLRFAVIVNNIANDISEPNTDARLVQLGDANHSRVQEEQVTISNGCICCTLRQDLLVEVNRLVKTGQFDYLLIESSGISEPIPIAETFHYIDEEGNSLSDFSRLDTLVTVVDGVNFETDFQSLEDLVERGIGLDETDQRDVVKLLVEQVEFANVLIISKTDLMEPVQLDSLQGLLKSLNPTAKVLTSVMGDFPLNEILNTGLFSEDWAEHQSDWLMVPPENEPFETDEYGFSRISFESRRPFHPARLMNLFEQDDRFDSVVRSKGIAWLATRNDHAGEWSHAGRVFSLDAAGSWAAAIPESEWPDEEELLEGIRDIWQEPFGDRRNELVFIGRHLDTKKLKEALEETLLNQQEMEQGPEAWLEFEDPFPEWLFDHHDEDVEGEV